MLALALAGSLAALAGPPEQLVHGYAKAAADWRFQDADAPLDLGSRLQLDLGQRRANLSWRAAFDLDSPAPLAADGADLAGPVSLRPVELRVGAHGGAWDLVVGKQYVFWGVTDWVNPTDLFTPWDYTHMGSELEDYRIAPWAVRATGWVGGSSIDLVWVPLPLPDVVFAPGTTGDGMTTADPELPDRDLAHGSFGLRGTTTVRGFDLSLMGYHGLDKRPGMDVRFDLSTMPPPMTLVPVHGTMTAVGGDLARGFGPVLLKAESAYYRTEDLAGTDPVVRNPELFSVAGLTWVPTTALNLSVQGTWNHLFAYDPDAEAEHWRQHWEDALGVDVVAVAEATGMPLHVPEADPVDAFGLVERIAWNWRDTVNLSLVGVQGAEDLDHFEMLLVRWRVADGLTALGGVILFGGPEGSRFGDAADDSQALAELKASF